jgi:hypothetical protein
MTQGVVEGVAPERVERRVEQVDRVDDATHLRSCP